MKPSFIKAGLTAGSKIAVKAAADEVAKKVASRRPQQQQEVQVEEEETYEIEYDHGYTVQTSVTAEDYFELPITLTPYLDLAQSKVYSINGIVLVSAEGISLVDEEGNPMLDAEGKFTVPAKGLKEPLYDETNLKVDGYTIPERTSSSGLTATNQQKHGQTSFMTKRYVTNATPKITEHLLVAFNPPEHMFNVEATKQMLRKQGTYSETKIFIQLEENTLALDEFAVVDQDVEITDEYITNVLGALTTAIVQAHYEIEN